MRKSIVAIGAITAAAALALSGCSSSGNGGKSGDDGLKLSTDGKGKTITVWSMNGDFGDDILKAINDKFTAATGAQVKVEIQQWDGIGTKVTTALAGDDAPDVIDVGNTQITGYAATGGLLDITSLKDELAQGQTWLGGLVDPATVDGKLYGVPELAGAREVFYNKKIWAAAGITSAPTTFDELKADLDKVKAANSDPSFSAFYLPGQYWYFGLGFVKDRGGDIVTGKEGAWKGALESDKSIQGLEDFKAFQNAYSAASTQSLNTDKPDQLQVFADGKAGAIFAPGWAGGVILDDNKKLTKDDLGTFAFPSITGTGTQPVFLGGSDWVVPVKSKNQGLALTWIKIAASPEIQALVAKAGIIPISNEAIDAASSSVDPLSQGQFEAAKNSWATPSAVNWATVEGDKTLETLFSAVASGSKSTADAAKAADQQIEADLNK